MTVYKAVIGDSKKGKSYSTTIEGQHATALLGKKIGDELDGIFFGLPGYKVKIAGGMDNSGFTMRPDLPGSGRKKLLVTKGHGFKPDHNGQRRRKMFRGNQICDDTAVINCVVTQYGPKKIDKLLVKSEEKEKKE